MGSADLMAKTFFGMGDIIQQQAEARFNEEVDAVLAGYPDELQPMKPLLIDKKEGRATWCHLRGAIAADGSFQHLPANTKVCYSKGI